ncbi:recombinase family protein [Trichococcus paludicola]|uniref:recombinase family protein n=1 Tax=Trichococcus paludicola TaxID=2052942 RepID=UPI001F27D80C|nr:recombinase family protein [Trichococcus paludicola]
MEGQQRQLEEERCDWVYFEKITGTKSDRPEFQKLLQEIQTGDTLVVTKLDRFAWSTQDALNTIKLLFGKGDQRNSISNKSILP